MYPYSNAQTQNISEAQSTKHRILIVHPCAVARTSAAFIRIIQP